MSRYIYIITIIFFLAGCSLKEPVKVGEKAFKQEDGYIMQALEYQKNKQFDKAVDTYNELYEKTNKINYLVEATKISFVTLHTEKTDLLLNQALKKYPENTALLRIKVALLMKEKKLQEAKDKVQELLKLEKNSRNLTIAGALYFELKSYDLSLKYFQSAYKESEDENALLNMVDVLYNYLNKKDEAISYLETHARIYGCSRKVCSKLLNIYGKEKDLEGIISVYKRLYKALGEEEYAKRVIELLLYKKENKRAIAFLEKSGYEPRMLLDVYASSHDFAGAFKVAKKLYKQEKDPILLGKMAIYEYEKNKKHMNKKILDSVSKKFEKVLKENKDPLFLNYYGYLLIDHDRNVKKGIKLVKEALKQEPNSIFYLDSLAWGLYKQKKCKAAKAVLDKVIGKTKEEEVLMHYKKIKECIQ